ncbi:methyl-accepting chemotaxis protein [Candidatus Magnetominusculus xianensis]|uniref:Methyl-accepting chemotaxis protein n=1 Tax=Candidatus Magnetominusculus xianensis TaxID=1748249 RepID=A0ABR5SHD8_9BACT|nr:methyl-accepting chemotaxis protein [Candidatus Magnetominusculus xianensis]KWT91105.1 methyl-accepting chemotaxis protein [Candidatus Magnetominusculus xianensis]MBF0403250.1 MCP four helix bundle domain-containing protein [Nitrospirota bacterium]
MSFLDNMKISTKLIGSFLLVSLIAACIGVFGIINLHKIDDADTFLYEKMTVPIGYLGDISTNFQRIRVNVRDLAEAATKEEMQKSIDTIKKLREDIDKLSTEYEKTIITDKGREAYKHFLETRHAYGEVITKVTELLLADKQEEAQVLIKGAGKKAAMEEQEAINTLQETKLKVAKETSDSNTALTDKVTGLIITITVIGMIIAMGLGIIISNSISNPLKRGVTFAEAVAGGDLSKKIDLNRKDEVGQLANALNDMVEKLKEVVASVRTAVDNVASGSSELSSGAQQLSEGATQQAASIEETSSSMEEMTSNIKQTTDNSRQTEAISTTAAKDALDSGKAVSEAVSAMKEIASKISIIEEIARQTNLLALNAAIEAARAGEHGKGFAVVASEVRKLAERSQKAAGEISELSASSVSIAEQAGTMLNKLVPDIRKTADLVQEITAASNEQNSGAEQINKAIQQLDQVIQQNASAAEEMASTSQELASQSDQLQSTIAFFKTGTEGAARVQTKAKHKPMAIAHAAATQRPKSPAPAKGKTIQLEDSKDHSDDSEFEKY